MPFSNVKTVSKVYADKDSVPDVCLHVLGWGEERKDPSLGLP